MLSYFYSVPAIVISLILWFAATTANAAVETGLGADPAQADAVGTVELFDVDSGSQEDLARFLEMNDQAEFPVPPGAERKPAVLGAATQEPALQPEFHLDYSTSNEAVIVDSIQTDQR